MSVIIFVGVVKGLSAAGSGGAVDPVAATAVAALVAKPARRWLQRGANRRSRTSERRPVCPSGSTGRRTYGVDVAASFVGRAREMASLGALCRAAFADQVPAAAVIVGEPGSGKTRLLSEVAKGGRG